MEKKNFKIRKKILIEPDMFYSEAFIGLSATALRTLLRCLQKRKWDNVKIHGKKKVIYSDDGFIFPYSEASFLGIGTTQHWNNIRSLIERGFLDIIHQGGWYQKSEKEKDYSVYKLSDRWKKYGTPEFEKIEKRKVLQPEFYIQRNIRKKNRKATSQKRSGHLHESEDDRAKQNNDRLHESEVGEKTQECRRRPVGVT